ncbi:ABC transporter [Bowdeniella nasicola]|uniref:ABC transporter n=1 Tax=Bowdeniella nasicola TaxID=208480 RepID=A0A1Q5Q2U4_9ACTO|nr:ABC transporter ATP-binding protein [Bowdeniella nasicola]OKL53960.1 ABC transporter [Bowdeniella nasicola]
MSTPGIQARGLRAGYGRHRILDGVDIDISAGKVTTIIGPNGSGKSTLLRSLSRTLPADGTLHIAGRDVQRMPRRELARIIGMLPQTPVAPDGIIVADLVSRGRHPHQSWLKQWSTQDERHVAQALELTRITDLAGRPVASLSGGQRQRVWISMVLAQQTPHVLLDEPTTYLDLAHAIDVLQLVGRLRDELARTIVMVLHDLNLAIRFSDELIVMRDGLIVRHGPPAEVISPPLLAEVFGLTALVVPDPVTGGPLIIPR